MSKELKPCPHCGAEAITGRNEDDFWEVWCSEYCQLYHDTQEEAAAAWNTRKDDDKENGGGP